MLHKGQYVPPLKEMVRTMRDRPTVTRWTSGMNALRRQVQRDLTPPYATRWSGRQWRLYRKAVQRGEYE